MSFRHLAGEASEEDSEAECERPSEDVGFDDGHGWTLPGRSEAVR